MVIACSRGVILNSLCVFAVPALLGKGAVWFPMIAAEAVTLCVAMTVKREMSKAHEERDGKLLSEIF